MKRGIVGAAMIAMLMSGTNAQAESHATGEFDVNLLMQRCQNLADLRVWVVRLLLDDTPMTEVVDGLSLSYSEVMGEDRDLPLDKDEKSRVREIIIKEVAAVYSDPVAASISSERGLQRYANDAMAKCVSLNLKERQ